MTIRIGVIGAGIFGALPYAVRVFDAGNGAAITGLHERLLV